MERNVQKQEAIHRMKMLNLHGNVLREFEKEDRLNMSEYGGFLYWLNSDQQAIVDEFEAEWDALVYHVIHSYTSIGEMLTLLYVSNYPEEWEYDDTLALHEVRQAPLHHQFLVYQLPQRDQAATTPSL